MLLASEEERKAGPTKSGVPQSSPTLLIPAGLHGAITVPESGESQDVIDRDRGTRAFARLEPTGSGQLESTPTQMRSYSRASSLGPKIDCANRGGDPVTDAGSADAVDRSNLCLQVSNHGELHYQFEELEKSVYDGLGVSLSLSALSHSCDRSKDGARAEEALERAEASLCNLERLETRGMTHRAQDFESPDRDELPVPSYRKNGKHESVLSSTFAAIPAVCHLPLPRHSADSPVSAYESLQRSSPSPVHDHATNMQQTSYQCSPSLPRGISFIPMAPGLINLDDLNDVELARSKAMGMHEQAVSLGMHEQAVSSMVAKTVHKEIDRDAWKRKTSAETMGFAAQEDVRQKLQEDQTVKGCQTAGLEHEEKVHEEKVMSKDASAVISIDEIVKDEQMTADNKQTDVTNGKGTDVGRFLSLGGGVYFGGGGDERKCNRCVDFSIQLRETQLANMELTREISAQRANQRTLELEIVRVGGNVKDLELILHFILSRRLAQQRRVIFLKWCQNVTSTHRSKLPPWQMCMTHRLRLVHRMFQRQLYLCFSRFRLQVAGRRSRRARARKASQWGAHDRLMRAWVTYNVAVELRRLKRLNVNKRMARLGRFIRRRMLREWHKFASEVDSLHTCLC